jgi:hypothetical protein
MGGSGKANALVARTSEATATDTTFILVFLRRIDVSILASGPPSK